jgi:serine/threonine-protein kinase
MQAISALQADWPHISRLLDEALALPAAQRSAWLDQLNPPDVALRATLMKLLAADAQASAARFLEHLPPLDAPVEADAPTQVGPYSLLRPLGRGGMASVWLAERQDGQLKRQIALKLPHASGLPGSAERVARWVARERDILAQLEHPNIARLYDAGVDRGADNAPRPWLAMEFVDGEPIDRWCAQRKSSLPDRIGLLLQAASAVAWAHGRLVVHRDLKPSNILVNAVGQVRLVDFGIARMLEEQAAGELTQIGMPFTPNYASPEQLRGTPLTTATDVFSLGVVAYELLSGQRPWSTPSASGSARAATREDAPAERASRRALRGELAAERAAERGQTPASLSRLLAGDLDAVLAKATAPDAAERYANMDALGADLQRWLDGRPVRARQQAPLTVLSKFVRRHRLGVSAGALAVTALLATTTVAIWQAGEARKQAGEAQRQEASARASSEFLLALFRDADPYLRGGRQATLTELLEPAERSLASLPEGARQDTQQLVATLWTHLGEVQRAARAQAALSAELETAVNSGAGTAARAALAASLVKEAVLADRRADGAAAQALLARAEAALPRAQWPAASRGRAEEIEGFVRLRAGQAIQAREHLQRAAALAREAGARTQEAYALRGLITAYQQLGQTAEADAAITSLRQTLALPGGLSPLERVSLLDTLASSMAQAGRWAEGWPVVQDLMAAADALYGTERPSSQLRHRLLWLRYGMQLDRDALLTAWVARLDPADPALMGYAAQDRAELHALQARLMARSAQPDRLLQARRHMTLARAALQGLPADQSSAWALRLSLIDAVVSLNLADPAAALAAVAPLAQDPALAASPVRPFAESLAAVASARLGRRPDARRLMQQAEQRLSVRGPPADRGLARINLALLLLDRPDDPEAARIPSLITQGVTDLRLAFGLEHRHTRAAEQLAQTLATSSADRIRLRQAAADVHQQLLF